MYLYFASKFLKCWKAFASLYAVKKDGEEHLSSVLEAIFSTFSELLHLVHKCVTTFKIKLRDLGIPDQQTKETLNTILDIRKVTHSTQDWLMAQMFMISKASCKH